MKTCEDFWLVLHNLAINLDFESQMPREKAQTILGLSECYPRVAGHEAGVEFRMLLAILLELDALLPKAVP